MSSEKRPRLRYTLAFRLTLWYAAVFTISSFLTFSILYVLLTSLIQKRTDQFLLKEFEEFSSLLGVKGVHEMKTALVLESEAEGIDKMFFRVLNGNGEVVGSSNMASWGKIGVNQKALKQLDYGSKQVFETRVQPGEGTKVRILYAMIGPGLTLQVGQSLKDDTNLMKIFRNTFIVIVLLLIIFAALTGWIMARRALQGVGEVTQTAQQISKGAFERRVPVKSRGYEIEQLAITFNEMVDKIEALIRGMREMTDNIAHELRSPLSRIRGIAEMTLTSDNPAKDCEVMAANTIEECDRLLEMINTMLDIAEVESGSAKLQGDDVDMAKILRDAIDLFQPIAEDRGLTILSHAPVQLRVSGNLQSLQRLVANLLDNALKYTPPGGTVTVSLRGDGDRAVIIFQDTGIGICEGDLPNIFKRFYRCDKSRSEPGIGLGLSLAQAIAKAHGGNITAASHLGEGSTFTVTLQRTPLLY